MDKTQRRLRPFSKAAIAAISLVVAALIAFFGIVGALNPVVSIVVAAFAFFVFVVFVFSIIYRAETVTYAAESSEPQLTVKTHIAQYDVYDYSPRDGVDFYRASSLPMPYWSTSPMAMALAEIAKSSRCYFALAHFTNNPVKPTEDSIAKSVSATITYYDKAGRPRARDEGIAGRWWSENEVPIGQNPREVERVDIYPNTQGATLALACMPMGESVIYAYNNESHLVKDYKKHEFSLGSGRYYAHVMLAGVHLTPIDFWFRIWRNSSSGELEIESEAAPDFKREEKESKEPTLPTKQDRA